MPSGTRLSLDRMPLTTSWTEPSPPTMITGRPSSAARLASSFASPRFVVSTYSACSCSARIRAIARYSVILPRLAAGLRITRGLPEDAGVYIALLLMSGRKICTDCITSSLSPQLFNAMESGQPDLLGEYTCYVKMFSITGYEFTSSNYLNFTRIRGYVSTLRKQDIPLLSALR